MHIPSERPLAQPDSLPVEELVSFFVHEGPRGVRITQLMKLIFLADVEHARRYGKPLCEIGWVWYDHGPFSPEIYAAVESLDERGSVSDTTVIDGRRKYRWIRPVRSKHKSLREKLAPSQLKVLEATLHRYGHMSLASLKQEAYATQTMRSASPGDRLDVGRDALPRLSERNQKLAKLRERVGHHEPESSGSPEESTAEDERILRQFAGLRAEANREELEERDEH